MRDHPRRGPFAMLDFRAFLGASKQVALKFFFYGFFGAFKTYHLLALFELNV